MKTKQIILIILLVYANCQGASKSITINESDYLSAATLTAAMPSKLIAEVNADSKAISDSSNKVQSAGSSAVRSTTETQVVPQNQFLLEAQKAVLRNSLPKAMPKKLLNYESLYECEDTLTGHTDRINSVIQLADGRLASCSWDKTIRIWAKNSEGIYKCVNILEGHAAAVNSIIQLNSRLVSVSDDTETRVWDLSKPAGKEYVGVIKSHRNCIRSVKQLADGRSVFTSFGVINSQLIHFISITPISKGQVGPDILEGHTDWVTSIIQLADGKLASGSADKTIRIWDKNSEGKYICIDVLKGHGEFKSLIRLDDDRFASITHAYFTLDEARGEINRIIDIWAKNSEGKYACVDGLKGHTSYISCLIQLKDGKLVSYSWNEIFVWAKNSQGKYECVDGFKGNLDFFDSVIQLADGRLASCSRDNTIRIWEQQPEIDPSKWDYLPTTVVSGTKTALDASRKSKSGGSAGCAAVACANGKATKQKSFLLETQKAVLHSSLFKNMPPGLCDIVQDYLYARYETFYKCKATLIGHTAAVNSMIQLSDGRLASCSHDGTIRIWKLNDKGNYECVNVLTGHTDWVMSLIQLADGKSASCSADKTIRIWDLSKPQGRDPNNDQRCLAVKSPAFSLIQLADGRLASYSLDKKIHIWDLGKPEGKECVDVLRGHTGYICCTIQLSDGILASCSLDNTIRIWRLNAEGKYECIAVLEYHRSHVNFIKQLSDGRLALGSGDGTIRILAKNSDDKYVCVDLLNGHTNYVRHITQLTDGRLASCSSDNAIFIWAINDQEQYQCVDVLTGHKDTVLRTIQLADGRLASCSHDGTIRIWDQSVIDQSRLDMPMNVVSDNKLTVDASSKSGGSAGCAAVDCANGKDTKQKSFDLQTQKAVLHSSLTKNMPTTVVSNDGKKTPSNQSKLGRSKGFSLANILIYLFGVEGSYTKLELMG